MKMKITFPSLYPHGAAPSFDFLPNSSISTQLQAKLKEALMEIALFHVENNQTCLYQCLCQLVNSLTEAEIVLDDSGTTLASKNSKEESPRALDQIPCPRFSGAVFSSTGKLLYWNSFISPAHPTLTPPRVRKYKDLLASVQNIYNSTPTFSISTYFYSSQNYKTTPTEEKKLPGQGVHKASNVFNDTVTLDDVSFLFPLSPMLGKAYQ
jgi:hypothetical protein